MFRVELVIAAAAAAMSISLAGCSGGMSMPDWMTPDWMSSKSSSPSMQPLRFESDPPGADVRTGQGQTCLTPCALGVPSEPQTVTIAKEGYVPQTIQVSVGDPPEHSFWESAQPPGLVPNPVQVVLQPAPPPPKPAIKHKPRKTVSRTRTAAKNTPPPPDAGAAPEGGPPQDGGAANPFPDPPPMQQPGASPFPPPPQGQ
jgi:hypothetical protein